MKQFNEWAMQEPSSAATAEQDRARLQAMKTNGINVCENLAYLGDFCAETFK